MSRLFLIVLLLLSHTVFSQNRDDKKTSQITYAKEKNRSYVDQMLAKPHFIFHFDSHVADTNAYYKAAYYYASKFNQFRYYDKRRVISIGNGATTIELFSVKELRERYQKNISSFVKQGDEDKIKIRFDFSNGFFKEQLTN